MWPFKKKSSFRPLDGHAFFISLKQNELLRFIGNLQPNMDEDQAIISDLHQKIIGGYRHAGWNSTKEAAKEQTDG